MAAVFIAVPSNDSARPNFRRDDPPPAEPSIEVSVDFLPNGDVDLSMSVVDSGDAIDLLGLIVWAGESDSEETPTPASPPGPSDKVIDAPFVGTTLPSQGNDVWTEMATDTDRDPEDYYWVYAKLTYRSAVGDRVSKVYSYAFDEGASESNQVMVFVEPFAMFAKVMELETTHEGTPKAVLSFGYSQPTVDRNEWFGWDMTRVAIRAGVGNIDPSRAPIGSITPQYPSTAFTISIDEGASRVWVLAEAFFVKRGDTKETKKTMLFLTTRDYSVWADPEYRQMRDLSHGVPQKRKKR